MRQHSFGADCMCVCVVYLYNRRREVATVELFQRKQNNELTFSFLSQRESVVVGFCTVTLRRPMLYLFFSAKDYV